MDEAAAIEQAFQVMTVVPNQANDMMDIGRLQGFEVSRYIIPVLDNSNFIDKTKNFSNHVAG